MAKAIVVDASVAFKWIVPEPGQADARELLKQSVFGDTHMIAPSTIRFEIASALAKRVRTKALTNTAAREAFRYFDQYRPLIMDDPKVGSDALGLALQHHVSYWDALYLALAIEYRCDLVTADTRFQRVAAKLYPYVVALGSS